MIRDVMLWISELLFYLQDGEKLINTPWLFVWIVFWVLVTVMPLWYVTNIRSTYRVKLTFLILFFPGILMAIGPGIVQTQMMQECETVESVTATERIDPTVITVKQCRIKDNYYGDFGEWKIVGQSQ